jgi:serine/threonine protein kinase
MSTVFRARDSALERDIALKVLATDPLQDDVFAERFQREAKVIARLEHPHIVPLYAVGIENGTPWMAMRLVSGGSVAVFVEHGAVERERALRILRGVARALDHAHSKGIVHRDVKPSNILLDEEERVYLADFGIARLLEGSTFVTRSGLVTGTPQYMAPEQARSEPSGRPGDVYSLGVVGYQLLTGRVPFTAESAVNVLMQHVMDPVPIPDASEVPPLVSEVLLRCLAKQSQHRWSTASAFVDALEAAFEGIAPDTIETPHVGSDDVTAISSLVSDSIPPSTSPELRGSPPPIPKAEAQLLDPRWEVPLPVAVGTLAVAAAVALVMMIREAPSRDETVAAAVAMTPTPSRTPPARAEAGATWVNPQDGLEYAYIPPTPGVDLGCIPGDERCDDDEKPRRRVSLTRGFWMGRTEVTVAAYRLFSSAVGRPVGQAPTFNPGWSEEAQPMVSLTWGGAKTYCTWAGGRLPTEAEWERAARGGESGRLYPWGGTAPECTSGAPNGARWGGCPDDRPGPVAQFSPNAFGLFDTTGNVWEWCYDWYDAEYYAGSEHADPRGPAHGRERVFRGGAANSGVIALRLSHRNHMKPAAISINVGWRCVLDKAE